MSPTGTTTASPSIDPKSLTVTGYVKVGLSPSGLAVTPDGKLLLSADRDSHQVSIIDTADLEVKTGRESRQAPVWRNH